MVNDREFGGFFGKNLTDDQGRRSAASQADRSNRQGRPKRTLYQQRGCDHQTAGMST